MAILKQSFLSNLIGENCYDECSRPAMKIVGIGGIVLAALFTVSLFFHSDIIKYLLRLTTGTSLLFIVYVAACILLMDIRVEVEGQEQERGIMKKESPKPL